MKRRFIFPVIFLTVLSANAFPLYQRADTQSGEYEIKPDREVVIWGETAEGFLEAGVLSSDRDQVEIAGYIQKVHGCNGRALGLPSNWYFRNCPMVLSYRSPASKGHQQPRNHWPDCTEEQLRLKKQGQRVRCTLPMWFVIDAFRRGMNR